MDKNQDALDPEIDTEEYHLVCRFYLEFSAATGQHDRTAVLEKYAKCIVTHQQQTSSDARAIVAVLEHHKQPSSRTVDWVALKSIASLTIQQGSVRSQSAWRKRCALKTLIALWSPELVRYYRWSLWGRDTLEQLVKAAERFPDWRQFAEQANLHMIERHDTSKDGRTLRIGQHPGRSGVHYSFSPLEIQDIRNVLKGKHPEAARTLQHRMKAWLTLCPCTGLSDEDCHEWALTKDQYGLVAPAISVVGREQCGHCIASVDDRPPRLRKRANNLASSSQQSPEPLGQRRTILSGSDPGRYETGTHKKRLKRRKCSTAGWHQHHSDQHQGQVRPEKHSTALQIPNVNQPAEQEEGTGRDRLARYNHSSSSRMRASCSQVPGRNHHEGLHSPATTDPSVRDACNESGLVEQLETQPCSGENIASAHLGPASHQKQESSFFRAADAPDCEICAGPCQKCVLPTSCRTMLVKTYHATAHEATSMDHLQQDLVASSWLRRIHYATLWWDPTLLVEDEQDVTESEADVWVLSAETFKRRALRGEAFPKPLVFKQTFSDTGEWNMERFADKLDNTYSRLSLPVHHGVTGTPELVKVQQVVEHLRSQYPEDKKALNALSLADITRCDLPSVGSLDRFTLLQCLVNRWKARMNTGIAEKQNQLTPFDVGSCLDFNILGFRGAFSGAHRDLLGGTWLRTLFGRKLWWVVNWDNLTEAERLSTTKEGRAWYPDGKERAIILEQDDVLILPHETPVVHAVLSLDTTLMRGGMFWDKDSLETAMQHVIWTGKYPLCTNEPRPLQLPALIMSLLEWLPKHATSRNRRLLSLISELRATGCRCTRGCGQHCTCRKSEARCTAFCKGHPSFPPSSDKDGKACMKI